MQSRFGFRHFLILILLAAFVFSPRPLRGLLQLSSARQSMLAGDISAAASAFAAASSRLPWQVSVYPEAGQAFWAAGDPQEAVLWFGRGEEHDALAEMDWLMYGDALSAIGDTDSAVQAWQQAYALNGSSLAAWRLGLASRQSGDFPAAIEYLMQVVAFETDFADAHYQLGLLLAVTDPVAALPQLLLASEFDPDLDASVQLLRTELNTALLVPDPAYQFTRSGRAVASLGQWDLAAEAFRRALQVDPGYAEAWAWLAEALQQIGSDGRLQLDRALDLAPGSASVQALDGLYWLRHAEPERALTSFQAAAALEPFNPAWQVALGDAAAASSDLVAASIYYRNAVVLGPDDASTWRALALFALENDSDVSSTGLLAARNLLRLAPDDWLTHDIAGRTALRIGAMPEALSQLQKAIELCPHQPAAHFHLAIAYLEFGQTALAYDKLVDTLAIDPEGAFGWQANRLLEEYFP